MVLRRQIMLDRRFTDVRTHSLSHFVSDCGNRSDLGKRYSSQVFLYLFFSFPLLLQEGFQGFQIEGILFGSTCQACQIILVRMPLTQGLTGP